jgi:predicted  nucleic acid-binding Zn-ribbon protein
MNLKTALALALTVALGTPAMAQNAEPAKPHQQKMDHSKMDHHKMMMEHCQKMMDEMKAQDVALTAEIAAMNSASKDAKVDLMAAVITRLAQQRSAMDEKMAGMHMEMMKHMNMGMEPKAHHDKAKAEGTAKAPK